jgi:hypothetical protein
MRRFLLIFHAVLLCLPATAQAVSTPQAVSAEPHPTSAHVSWARNLSEERPGYVYRVYRSTSQSGPWTIQTPEVAAGDPDNCYARRCQILDLGLMPGATYYYRVTARDMLGNESAKSNVTIAASWGTTRPADATVPAFSAYFSGGPLKPTRWDTCWVNIETDDCAFDEKRAATWYGRTYDCTSGNVATGGRAPGGAMSDPLGFAFQYGYAEIRARLPDSVGMRPTFWLCSEYAVGLYCPREIDVFEVLGSTVYMSVHDHPNNVHSTTGWDSNAEFHSDYHVYGIDWTASYIRWYVDGVLRRELTTPASLIPRDRMYLLITLLAPKLGRWGGDPPAPDSSFPMYFTVDHVNVWQRP